MNDSAKLDMVLKNQVAIMRELILQAREINKYGIDPRRSDNIHERISATAKVVGL